MNRIGIDLGGTKIEGILLSNDNKIILTDIIQSLSLNTDKVSVLFDLPNVRYFK